MDKSVEPSSIEEFDVIKRIINIAFLSNVAVKGSSVVVIMKQNGLRHDSMSSYDITIDAKHITFPPLCDVISSNPGMIKVCCQHQNVNNLQLRRLVKNESEVNSIKEEVKFISADNFEIVESKSKCAFEEESSLITLNIGLSDEIGVQFASNLKIYLHHLHAAYHSTCYIALHLVDKTNNFIINFSTPFAVDRVVEVGVASFYNEAEVDSNIVFKKSNPVSLDTATGLSEELTLKLTVEASVLYDKSDNNTISSYVYWPFGIPVISKAINCTVNNLISWDDYGLKMGESLNDHGAEDRMKPFFASELCSTYEDTELFSLIMIMLFHVRPVPTNWKEKMKVIHYMQDHFDDMYKSNMALVQRSCSQALDQLLQRTKHLKWKRSNEIAVANTTNSIFDIVTFSTNEVFRETCMSLMGSVTTHGLQDDLYSALSSYTRRKLDCKKRKEEKKGAEDIENIKDDTEWKMMEDCTRENDL